MVRPKYHILRCGGRAAGLSHPSKIAPCIKKPFKIADLNRTINEIANRSDTHAAENEADYDRAMDVQEEQVELS